MSIVIGWFLTAEQGGGLDGNTYKGAKSTVMMNRTVAQGWEHIVTEDNGDDTISFKCGNGCYITAEGGGGGLLSTNRTAKGPWEKFDKATLKCNDGNHYLGMMKDGLGVDARATAPSLTFRQLGSATNVRPSPIQQIKLSDWEPDDPANGLVHRTQPPDLVIPSAPDRDFFIGDIGGVMLSADDLPPFGASREDKLALARSLEANTTPLEMTMSYMVPHYAQFDTRAVDAFLTAHAIRDYPHFHLSRGNADDANMSDKDFCDLIEYIQSWGFLTPAWLTGSKDDRSRGWSSIGNRVTAFLKELLSRPQSTLDKFVALPGEELNNGCPPGPDGVDSIINGVCQQVSPYGIPVWAHFTANYSDYPVNPRTDASAVQWWQQWIGKMKGLCWQANGGTSPESAGLMGARLWDARRILYRADPSFKVAAFEILATAQLYGKATEEEGCLRSLELLYCTSDGTAGPVSGSMGGLRLPDGSSVRKI